MAQTWQSYIQKFKDSEASTSVLFGFIVVIVAGVLMLNYFQGGKTAQVSEEGALTEMEQTAASDGSRPSEYTVEQGDSLWKIAEKIFGSGYNWVDLAKANNLDNPSVIAVGMKLSVPQVEAKAATKAVVTLTAATEIKGDAYEVVKGDTLWDISVRAYGDGYAWTKIWEANKTNIPNPGLIEVGHKLSIPRF